MADDEHNRTGRRRPKSECERIQRLPDPCERKKTPRPGPHNDCEDEGERDCSPDLEGLEPKRRPRIPERTPSRTAQAFGNEERTLPCPTPGSGSITVPADTFFVRAELKHFEADQQTADAEAQSAANTLADEYASANIVCAYTNTEQSAECQIGEVGADSVVEAGVVASELVGHDNNVDNGTAEQQSVNNQALAQAQAALDCAYANAEQVIECATLYPCATFDAGTVDEETVCSFGDTVVVAAGTVELPVSGNTQADADQQAREIGEAQIQCFVGNRVQNTCCEQEEAEDPAVECPIEGASQYFIEEDGKNPVTVEENVFTRPVDEITAADPGNPTSGEVKTAIELLETEAYQAARAALVCQVGNDKRTVNCPFDESLPYFSDTYPNYVAGDKIYVEMDNSPGRIFRVDIGGEVTDTLPQLKQDMQGATLSIGDSFTSSGGVKFTFVDSNEANSTASPAYEIEVPANTVVLPLVAGESGQSLKDTANAGADAIGESQLLCLYCNDAVDAVCVHTPEAENETQGVAAGVFCLESKAAAQAQAESLASIPKRLTEGAESEECEFLNDETTVDCASGLSLSGVVTGPGIATSVTVPAGIFSKIKGSLETAQEAKNAVNALAENFGLASLDCFYESPGNTAKCGFDASDPLNIVWGDGTDGSGNNYSSNSNGAPSGGVEIEAGAFRSYNSQSEANRMMGAVVGSILDCFFENAGGEAIHCGAEFDGSGDFQNGPGPSVSEYSPDSNGGDGVSVTFPEGIVRSYASQLDAENKVRTMALASMDCFFDNHPIAAYCGFRFTSNPGDPDFQLLWNEDPSSGSIFTAVTDPAAAEVYTLYGDNYYVSGTGRLINSSGEETVSRNSSGYRADQDIDGHPDKVILIQEGTFTDRISRSNATIQAAVLVESMLDCFFENTEQGPFDCPAGTTDITNHEDSDVTPVIEAETVRSRVSQINADQIAENMARGLRVCIDPTILSSSGSVAFLGGSVTIGSGDCLSETDMSNALESALSGQNPKAGDVVGLDQDGTLSWFFQLQAQTTGGGSIFNPDINVGGTSFGTTGWRSGHTNKITLTHCGPETGEIEIDASDPLLAGKTLKLHEEDWCDDLGNEKKVLILRSEPYEPSP